jgi:hypothetical protein
MRKLLPHVLVKFWLGKSEPEAARFGKVITKDLVMYQGIVESVRALNAAMNL